MRSHQFQRCNIETSTSSPISRKSRVPIEGFIWTMHVEEQSGWGANIVYTINKDEWLRISVDQQKLNKALQCNPHKVPNFEEITAKLAGTAIISTLGAKLACASLASPTLKFNGGLQNLVNVQHALCEVLLASFRATNIARQVSHDEVIKWIHFPHYWLFGRGIHRWLVNSPHKGQWRRALKFSLIYAWMKGWINNRGAGDLRRHRAHYDVTVMR